MVQMKYNKRLLIPSLNFLLYPSSYKLLDIVSNIRAARSYIQRGVNPHYSFLQDDGFPMSMKFYL